MNIGHHFRKNTENWVEENLQINKNIKACQIFAVGPKNTSQIITDKDIQLLKKSNLKIIVHGTYFDHIIGPKKHYAFHMIKKEYQICQKLNAKGLVIHFPIKPINELEEIADNIHLMFTKLHTTITSSNVKPMIYMETASSKDINSLIYITKLFNLINKKLSNHQKQLLGFTIDTAHLWSSGVNISSYDSMNEYLVSISNIINPSKIIFHLNDQYYDFNSGKDQHCNLYECNIWKNVQFKHSGLIRLLEFANENKSITILETKDPAKDYTFLESKGFM